MKKNKKEQEKILKVITEFIESLELLREALVKALVKVFECKDFKKLIKKACKEMEGKVPPPPHPKKPMPDIPRKVIPPEYHDEGGPFG